MVNSMLECKFLPYVTHILSWTGVLATNNEKRKGLRTIKNSREPGEQHIHEHDSLGNNKGNQSEYVQMGKITNKTQV